MSIIVPRVGELKMLDYILDVTGHVLKLFSNNVTLSSDTVLADLTEVTGGGYAAITLDKTKWNYTAGTGVNPSYGTYSEFATFTFSGAPSVPTAYGYYIISSGGVLLMAEKFPSVVSLSNGVSIPVRPKFTLISKNLA